ncbi:MAG: hypothetical protein IIT46_13670 [Lachnospiraceae bacterium]|nr:hypothetical protein [Lachnospiraceae bacterium]
MENIKRKIMNICEMVIMLFFTCFVTVLFLGSVVGSYMVDINEHSYFKKNNSLLVLCGCVVVLLFVLCVKNRITLLSKIKYKKIIWIIFLVFYGVGMCVFALYLGIKPRADQGKVIEVAMQMVKGDFSAFQKGGYMYIYPNQVGIVYFFYWITKRLHSLTGIVTILNCLSVIITIIAIQGIGRVLKKDKEDYSFGIVAFLFLPLHFYVTFIYGNLIGLALSMVGVWFTMLYLEEQKALFVIIAICSIAFSVVIKENYIIPMIGVLVVLLLDMIKQPKKLTLIFLLGCCGSTLLISSGVKWHTERIVGTNLSEGVPSLAWITMGIYDGDVTPGWCNGYNESVFRNNDCNQEKTKKQIAIDFSKQLSHWKTNPGKFINYLIKKNNSQWNNPTFECFWINSISLRKTENIETKEYGKIVNSLTDELGNKLLVFFMDCYQSIVWFGTLCWLILERKKEIRQKLLPAIIFIGGFVFHTFWEAKCQYTFSYFLIIIPYSIVGLHLLSDKIKSRE